MIPVGDGPDSTPRRPLRHAVVIGGGIAGLLAARVLSDHFERVTLLERHSLARAPAPRRGVPQGAHVHVLLARGLAVAEACSPAWPRSSAPRGPSNSTRGAICAGTTPAAGGPGTTAGSTSCP